jgi:hypothetical protein
MKGCSIKCSLLYFFSMKNLIIFFFIFLGGSCKKQSTEPSNPTVGSFYYSFIYINGTYNNGTNFNVPVTPSIKIAFTHPLNTATAANNISFTNSISGQNIASTFTYQNGDSDLIIQPSVALAYLNQYKIVVSKSLKDKSNDTLLTSFSIYFTTQIDSSNKFPLISDTALLTLIEQQTFNYFWKLGNPVSGMAQERTSSGATCATGGTGFGVMSMLAAVNRNFISRTDALARIQTIVSFYKNNCTAYHGAFAHWINGNTGITIPFSTQDDGADIVETSYLMQGLLCARQYFNENNAAEDSLRSNINALWNAVDWNWFRQNGQNTLYWHWSPDFGWEGNSQVQGWNEALITYVLASSSNTSAIPKIVYDNGWAQNGSIINGNKFYGITLPLGPDYGGPLFFAHYSFLGINPNQLSDAYANYWTQDTSHANINYDYCVTNPQHFNGYSSSCWGLTACDIQNGYNANSPTSDDGVIAPTAAISSLPYTPVQSMNALRFFYYQLGNKIWGQYGFIDAFNLTNIWFDTDCLAIDQGPEIVMIENYRSGLLWNLFMSCPEVQTGMLNLGFTSPYL